MPRKRKFKVGDKVRVIPDKAISRSAIHFKDKIGTIIEINDDHWCYLDIEKGYNDRSGIWLYEIELVVPKQNTNKLDTKQKDLKLLIQRVDRYIKKHGDSEVRSVFKHLL